MARPLEGGTRLGSRSRHTGLPRPPLGGFFHSLILPCKLGQPHVTWGNGWELDSEAEQLGVKCHLCL